MKMSNMKTFIILNKNKLKSVGCLFLLACGIVFASIATDLGINGVLTANRDIINAEISNLQVKSGSVSANDPIINTTSIEQVVTLSQHENFYEYSFDITNNGDEDLMIDEVIIPENDSKVTYTVKYDGTFNISQYDLLAKDETLTIVVRVEYTGTNSGSISNVDAGIGIKYIKADENAEEVVIPSMILDDSNNNGVADVGEIISVDTEDFYVISNDGTNIKALAKWNLLVGNIVEERNVTLLSNPTGLQDESAKGWRQVDESDVYPFIGTTAFSSTDYWNERFTSSPYTIDLTDSNNNIYPYLQDYKTALEEKGGEIEDVTLITYEELVTLGCDDWNFSCLDAPSWVYQTTYWSGSACAAYGAWVVFSDGRLGVRYYYAITETGVRPVINVLASNLYES